MSRCFVGEDFFHYGRTLRGGGPGDADGGSGSVEFYDAQGLLKARARVSMWRDHSVSLPGEFRFDLPDAPDPSLPFSRGIRESPASFRGRPSESCRRGRRTLHPCEQPRLRSGDGGWLRPFVLSDRAVM